MSSRKGIGVYSFKKIFQQLQPMSLNTQRRTERVQTKPLDFQIQRSTLMRLMFYIIIVKLFMYRLKTQTNTRNPQRLQIKIPDFSHSEEKEYKQTIRVVKSRSNTQPLKQKYSKEFPPQTNQSPSNRNPNFTKLLKMKWESKSPKNRSNSPAYREVNQNKISNMLHKSQNTARNIDEVKKKLQTYKVPMRLNSKYFKKELNINEKLEDMNKTLKKVAQMKNVKKPRYQLKMLKKLGKSQTGEIILAISNVNNILVALKSFDKQKIRLEFLIDQMKIHLYCQHPNILPAYGYHIGRDEVFLVMEYGFHNLYQQILRTGPFNQQKTARYLIQIVSGIEYLHRNGIMHRDLKPQNVICFGQLLKITDFGWSIKTDRQRRTLCGTLDYISPEVADRSYYDNKIDCWSIGVMMYEMLMVQPPFTQQTQNYEFSTFKLPIHLSYQSKDLLTKLLEVDPKKRLTARQALDHPFLENYKKSLHLGERKRFKELKVDFEMVYNFQ